MCAEKTPKHKISHKSRKSASPAVKDPYGRRDLPQNRLFMGGSVINLDLVPLIEAERLTTIGKKGDILNVVKRFRLSVPGQIIDIGKERASYKVIHRYLIYHGWSGIFNERENGPGVGYYRSKRRYTVSPEPKEDSNKSSKSTSSVD